ncbi:MAG: hypothetical protein C4589_07165 [Peptococcaceae bacterium]|nr:MAG: hypothetical protein C4589_07165 [Peptococcaceae bacterium]
MIGAIKHKKENLFHRFESRLTESIFEPIIFSLKARLVKMRTNRECWKNSRFPLIKENEKPAPKKTYWKNLLDSWGKEDD